MDSDLWREAGACIAVGGEDGGQNNIFAGIKDSPKNGRSG